MRYLGLGWFKQDVLRALHYVSAPHSYLLYKARASPDSSHRTKDLAILARCGSRRGFVNRSFCHRKICGELWGGLRKPFGSCVLGINSLPLQSLKRSRACEGRCAYARSFPRGNIAQLRLKQTRGTHSFNSRYAKFLPCHRLPAPKNKRPLPWLARG